MEGMVVDAAIVNQERLGAAFQSKLDADAPLRLEVMDERKMKDHPTITIVVTVG